MYVCMHAHTSFLHDVVHWTGHRCQRTGRVAQNQFHLVKLIIFWFTQLKGCGQEGEVSESQGMSLPDTIHVYIPTYVCNHLHTYFKFIRC